MPQTKKLPTPKSSTAPEAAGHGQGGGLRGPAPSELRKRLREGAESVVEDIVKLARDVAVEPEVRLEAMRLIIEYSIGKPAPETGVSGEASGFSAFVAALTTPRQES